MHVKSTDHGDGLTLDPSAKLEVSPLESLYTGPQVCMWKEPVKGWEYVTSTMEGDFGGVLVLTAEKRSKILIKVERDQITGADIVKLPSRDDLVRESRMQMLPSIQTPTSSGLTSQHNQLDFWSVKVNDKTFKKGLELVDPLSLPARLSELTSKGALIDPALLAAVTWYALNNPEKFVHGNSEPLSISDSAKNAAFTIATKDRGEDPVSHSSKFILIRKMSSESGAEIEYAARPSNVIGAVIAPALVQDKDGNKFLVLAKQYRPPIGAEVYSHTAGLIGDKDISGSVVDVAKVTEKVRATLQAELSEEVGAVSLSDSDALKIAFVGVSAPGLSTELHFFTPVKVRLDGVGGGAATEGEKIDRVLLPFKRDSILNFVRSQTVTSATEGEHTVRVETSFLAGLSCFLPELLEQK